MTTATVFVAGSESSDFIRAIESWSFFSTPRTPHVLDMPTLSTRERLALELSENPRHCLEFSLPKSVLKKDPLEMYSMFYRVYPHFARVDI